MIRDIAFWRNENELVLMNAFGRLDFVTSKNIPPPTDDGSTPLHDWDADPISSVRPQFEFDRKRAVRRSPAKAVAVASLPQIDTILELFENGVVNTIVMPHGARIEFKEDEALISTY